MSPHKHVFREGRAVSCQLLVVNKNDRGIATTHVHGRRSVDAATAPHEADAAALNQVTHGEKRAISTV